MLEAFAVFRKDLQVSLQMFFAALGAEFDPSKEILWCISDVMSKNNLHARQILPQYLSVWLICLARKQA
jgi:hypothetical protein